MGRLARFIRFYTDEDDGNGGEKGVLKTVTGALLHVVDALAKPAHKFTATLEPIQDLHGQDAPYPSGGGVNKLDPSQASLVNYTLCGLAASWSTDGVLTLIGTWTGSTGGGARILEVPSAVRSLNVKGFESSGHVSLRWQNGEDKIVADFSNMVQDNSYNLTVYPIIYEGSTAPSSWSPYSNICPITGHTGANVVRTGKNMLDDSIKTVVGTRLCIGTTSTRDNPTYLKAGTYSISVFGINKTYGYLMNGTTALKTIIANNNKGTFAVDVDGYYRLDLYGNDAISGNVTGVMLVSGSTAATSCETYKGTTIPITFPDAAGTVYGGTLTNEDGEWKLRVDRISVTETTNTGWNPDSSLMRAYKQFSGIKPSASNTEPIDAIANYLSPLTQAQGTSKQYQGFFFGGVGSTSISIHINGVTDYGTNQEISTALGTYLAEHPLQIVYKLETPIDYTLTETQALTLLKDTNNIWTDIPESELELTYLAKATE